MFGNPSGYNPRASVNTENCQRSQLLSKRLTWLQSEINVLVLLVLAFTSEFVFLRYTQNAVTQFRHLRNKFCVQWGMEQK